MKIRGRFIGILAVLGLLLVLVPLAQAGAVAGEVKLTGGEKGQYFSDQTDYNIVTIEINDPDLTPLRTGTARTSDGSDVLITGTDNKELDLTAFVVAGEKEVTQRFDGGASNPVCNHDDDPSTDTDEGSATPNQRAVAADLNFGEGDCASEGDAIVTDDVPSGGTATITNTTAADTFRFNLQDGAVARDRQSNSQAGVGDIGPDDIISLAVNGRTATASKDDGTAPDNIQNAPWFSILEEGEGGEADKNGGGILAIEVHNIVPQNVANTVSVTFTDTEFKFDGTTPLDIDESAVNYGGTVDPLDPSSTGYTNATKSTSVAAGELAVVSTGRAVSDHVIVSFAYDVLDKFASNRSMVTLSSTSAGDIRLATEETTANSDTFRASVAVFSQEDRSSIDTAAGDIDASGDPSVMVDGVEVDEGIVNMDELIAVLDNTGGSRSLYNRVLAAAEALGYDTPTIRGRASAEALLDKIVQARHGDVITVTYQDANPASSVSQAARVDLEAPVVTLVSPADGFFTNIASVSMSAEVTDTGAGVDQNSIELKINLGTTGLSRGAAVETPIEGGYRVTAGSEGSISEGEKKWFVGVMDKVGNVPVRDVLDDNKPEGCGVAAAPDCGTGPAGVNEAPKGAASNLDSEADNPFKFTVDTRAPSLTAGKTGLSLKNPGVTSGTNKETERTNQNTWVRVTFDTGEGGAPLDPSTVSASDFLVNDAGPLDAKVSSVSHADDTVTFAKGTAVYLQVGQMDTDARPEVVLSGEIRDMAGNPRTEGRLPNIGDGLAPKLTVTPSADIHKDEITTTITSSETLRSNPKLELTETRPVKGVSLNSPVTRPVSLQTGSLTTWTSVFKNASGQASKQYVAVTASDAAGNDAEIGIAATETDFVSFQVDSAAPSLSFVDAGGNDLKSTKQEEGSVWLVALFDDDEGRVEDGSTNDSFRNVEVTTLKLMNKDTEEVITEAAADVFGVEVDCVDQDTGRRPLR